MTMTNTATTPAIAKMNWWEIPVPDLDDAKIGGDMGRWAAFTEPAGRWIGFSTSDPAGA